MAGAATVVTGAVCLAAVCAVMLAQSAGREFVFFFRGADDITAWLTAAAA